MLLFEDKTYAPQTLRDYQQEAIAAIQRDWAAGESAPLIAVATGGGKTTIIAQLLVDTVDPLWQRALVIGHTEEIITQLYERIANQFGGRLDSHFGDYSYPGIGIVMNENDVPDARIVIATRQSLHKKRLERLLKTGAFDAVVIDECFPAGTLVDGKPIEMIRIGDVVTAFDEQSGNPVQAEVTHVFARPVGDKLCRITIGQQVIICTPNHPFLTANGWKPAVSLTSEDMVQYIISSEVNSRVDYVREETANHCQLPYLRQRGKGGYTAKAAAAQEVQQGLLLKTLLLRGQNWNAQNRQAPARSCNLSSMQQAILCDNRNTKAVVADKRLRLLLEGMQQPVSGKGEFTGHGRNQSQICIGANEAKEPDAQSNQQAQDANYAACIAVEACASTGQWNGVYPAPTLAGGGAGLADGIWDLHLQTQGRWLSGGLQNRHCRADLEDCHRGGWGVSQIRQSERGRSEENRVSAWVRVDSVEILESRGDRELGGLCPGGLVYNLEVTPHHTYTVGSGIVVHNCHHAFGDNSYGQIVRQLRDANPDVKFAGVTATPVGRNGRALASVFTKISYEWLIPEGIASGYLVPVTRIKILTDVDLSSVETAAGDYNQKKLLSVLGAKNWLDLATKAYMDYVADKGRPCLAFLPSVVMSQQFAESLRKHRVAAAHIDGTTPKDERRKLLRDYADGKLETIVNCAVLTEGFDAPATGVIFLARPTRSRTLFTQIIGRGLHPYPGKHDCWLVDLTVLDTKALEVGTLTGRMLTCEECGAEYYAGMKACPHCGHIPEKRGHGVGLTVHDDWQGGSLIANYEALFERAFAAWYQGTDGFFSCTLGFEDGAFIIVPPLEDNFYRLVHVPKAPDKSPHTLKRNEDLASLMIEADQEVGKRAHAIAQKDAAWRGETATIAQLSLLAKLNVEVPAGISKGSASQLITHTLAVKRLVTGGTK